MNAASVRATRSLRDEALDQDAHKLLAAHAKRRNAPTPSQYRQHADFMTSGWEAMVWRRAASIKEQESNE